MTYTPPLKINGIKTKLIPAILHNIQDWDKNNGSWVEPFMGSGCVGFNVLPQHMIMNDLNPHLPDFYRWLVSQDAKALERYLVMRGILLAEIGDNFYYTIRSRYNQSPIPADFLFLNRTCFNGVVRFNRKGEFNSPFCHKPNRFNNPAFLTKVMNQVQGFQLRAMNRDWKFTTGNFDQCFQNLSSKDFVYCDPPYIGRHTNYYDQWGETEENKLYELLTTTKASWMLSTWIECGEKRNPFYEKLWAGFNTVRVRHKWKVSGLAKGRGSVTEALVMSYTPPPKSQLEEPKEF